MHVALELEICPINVRLVGIHIEFATQAGLFFIIPVLVVPARMFAFLAGLLAVVTVRLPSDGCPVGVVCAALWLNRAFWRFLALSSVLRALERKSTLCQLL